jgi:hypothetical protein
MTLFTRVFKTVMASTLSLGMTSEVLAQAATTPPNQQQVFGQLILQMFEKNNGVLVCPGPDTNLQNAGDTTLRYLKATSGAAAIGPDAVNRALVNLYPCPFAPFRAELAPANVQELIGAWVYPNGSQKFRFPPKANATLPTGAQPVLCDVVGLFEGGEMRTAVVPGRGECPYKSAADVQAERKYPRVLSWSLLSDGRMQVKRSDKATHVEEWDVFAVKKPFDQYGVQFRSGDLVMYLRRSANNSGNVAEEFKHLQRLNP